MGGRTDGSVGDDAYGGRRDVSLSSGWLWCAWLCVEGAGRVAGKQNGVRAVGSQIGAPGAFSSQVLQYFSSTCGCGNVRSVCGRVGAPDLRGRVLHRAGGSGALGWISWVQERKLSGLRAAAAGAEEGCTRLWLWGAATGSVWPAPHMLRLWVHGTASTRYVGILQARPFPMMVSLLQEFIECSVNTVPRRRLVHACP